MNTGTNAVTFVAVDNSLRRTVAVEQLRAQQVRCTLRRMLSVADWYLRRIIPFCDGICPSP
ncbi:hypothetical protein COLO4_03743 [Corchorus olitorius]|uniref:Uncharacterized protein n=1 Tax=Corchorus olitorius TaxID=93759 RepID=A0A1R3KX50_9ROSI|nr:hypothetical protein COLO4_03743 [Corchorus olitorius]